MKQKNSNRLMPETHFLNQQDGGEEKRITSLKAEYMDIISRLDRFLENGSISAYMRKLLIEMSNKVVENLAQKYEKVREGVKSVMGGKVLEYEAKRILNEGRQESRSGKKGFLFMSENANGGQ